MKDRTCANCQHWGQDKPFGAYGIDFCCREDSAYYNELTNSDSYCKAWEAEDGAAEGGNMTAQIYTCPKCGRPFELFYNAGEPCFGCVHCFRNTQLTYSDHTEPPKEEE